MPAIFTGLGAGLARSSASVLGGSGLLGSATLGRGGDNVMVNAATGNLVITRQDEFLVGRGPDLGISRTYNSLAQTSDGDNGDQWQMSTVRRVFFGLTETLNTEGSTVSRQGADGAVILYTWDASKAAYVTTEGDGAHDKLVKSGSSWVWTDGSSQVSEVYLASAGDPGVFRIAEHKQATGYKQTFTYFAGTDKLDRVTTYNDGTANAATGVAEQSYVQYLWSGNNVSQIVTGYTDYGDSATEADNVNRTLTRTRYGYDGSNRLITVTVDLSPENNSISDGRTYVTTYTYDGTSDRVASITQTDSTLTGGSSLAITYDASGRVQTLTEAVTASETRLTTLAYGASYTTITGPDNQVTRLDYDGGNLVDASVATWSAAGVTREAGGTIGGEAATLLTSSAGAASSYVARSIGAIAAGTTVTFAVSLQAVAGSATTQGLGLYGATNGWGTGGVSARIVSGPGTLTTSTSGFWKVSGLSTTEATRIEITRTYAQSEASAGAYVYVDHPTYNDGQKLLVADAAVTVDPVATDWSASGVGQTATTIGSGAAATMLTSSVGASSSYVLHSLGTVAAGTTVRFSVSLQAVAGSATTQGLGLHGLTSSYGSGGVSARIVSGPGTLLTSTTGLWQVTGLSTTEATRIEITRTYAQSEVARAVVYVDQPGGYRDGQKLIYADAAVAVEGETRRLTKITAPPAYTGAAPQTVQFDYDREGNLASVTDGAGKVTDYTYDAWGNQLTSNDANNNTVTRTYGTKNELLTETRTGSDASGAAVSHTTRYAYDAYNRLRYVVSAEGRVTEYRYYYEQVSLIVEYPEHSYAIGSVAPTEADMNGWRDDLTDRSSTKITNNVYDARGNLLYYVDYGYATTAGGASTAEAYSRTYYTHDQAGRLLSRYGQGEAAETFVYDGLGRLTAAVDTAGGTTTYRFNDASTTTIVHLASGLTRTLVYNKVGDLVSETTSTPGYQPDELYADIADWGYARMTRTAATPIGGEDAYTYTMDATGSYGVVNKSVAVAEGETVTWRITVKGNPADAHRVGLYGSTEGWGTIAATDASAVIVKGPGAIAHHNTYGGLFDLTGLSETQETVIELRRTYAQAQSATAYFYVGGTGSNVPAGMAVTLAATNLTKTVTDANEDISSASGYLYDKNGRLRVATDAGGHETYFVYDKAGRKVAEVNEYGHVTEYRYDAAGRVVATVRYDAVTPQLAALANPNNVLEMSAIRPALPDPDDVWSWSVYDAGGRLIQSIDGDGGVAVFSYDASDRLVKTLSYYNKLTANQLTELKTNPPVLPMLPSALELPTANSAKDSVSRTFYDRDGRQIGALDGEGYLTEIVYDDAGQKVEEIAYATITSSGYWAAGTLTQLRPAAATADRRVHHVYDGQGLLRYSIDSAGRASSFAYNAAGKLTATIAHAAPISTSDFTYDNVKALVAAIASDANDRESYTVYNAKGQAAYAIEPGGQVTGFTYDIAGRVTKSVQYAVLRATPSLPAATTMDTWAAGQASNTANRVTRNWYSAAGELRFSVDGEGYVSRFDYDVEGQLTGEASWSLAVTATDTTTIAQIATLASGGTGIWTQTVGYEYDAAGRRYKVTDGEGNRTVKAWNANGWLASVTYGQGTADESRTRYEYDGAGRIKAEYHADSQPEQAVVRYGYDGLGNRTSVTDANDNTTTYVYDERGLLKSSSIPVTDALGVTTTVTTQFDYNAFGEVVKVTDARGGKTFTWYDELGRVKALAQQYDTVAGVEKYYLTTTTYTAFGEVESVKRWATPYSGTPAPATQPTVSADAQKDAVTQFAYDKDGQLKTTTDAESFIESYTYNAFGERDSVTAKSETDFNADRTDNVTTFAYDRRGLMIGETLPMSSVNDAGTVLATSVTNSFDYDSRGNRTKETRAAGLAEQTVTQYIYDKASRLIERIDPTYHGTLTPHTYYAYDARGNLTRTTAPGNARTVHFYDDLGRVTAEINAVGTYTAYTYDPNGNVTAIKVYETAVAVPADGGSQEEAPAAPAGNYRETTFKYDDLNRLLTSKVGENAAAAVTTGSWNGSAWVSATAALTTTYQYDAAGNVVKTSDPNGNATWAYYDALGRKTIQIDAAGYRTDWSYNAEGNVTQETRYWNPGSTPTSTTTPPAVPAHDARFRSTGYTYDRVGNRTAEVRHYVAIHDGAGGSTQVHAQISYAYNGLGQVTRKTEATLHFVDYQYDDAGRLTQETRSGFTDHTGATATPVVQYSYNGLGGLTRTRQAGNATAADRITTYGYEGGKLRWMKDPEYNDGTTTDGKLTYYYYDLAGNLQYEYYGRRDSSGNYADDNELEGVFRVYDGLGRVTQQWFTQNPVGTGSWTQVGPTTTTAYNAWGEVKSVQVGTGALQQNTYDKAGRLVASNMGDGVWKHFGYDKNGNQTIAIASAGENLAGLSFAQALAKVGESDVNATYTVYDVRGLATQVVEEQRELNASTAQTLTSSRGYNAFGEVAWEIAANDARIDYTYNSMGRMIRSESPTVSITLEDGTSRYVRPSEDYYYDASGRLVATRDANGTYATGGTSTAGTSKAANTGNLTRLTLLAHSGYGGSQALVTSETYANAAAKETKYDIHGDARVLIDELDRSTTQTFDQMGRVIQVDHKWNVSEYYTYDVLGQQLKHWNSVYGSTDAETTDYDVQGRVTSQRSYGGDVTATSYTWEVSSLTDTAVGSFGGWKRVVDGEGHDATFYTDLFGRDTDPLKQYDVAGRLVLDGVGQAASAQSRYEYYNTGKLKRVHLGQLEQVNTTWANRIFDYEYDELGRLTREKQVRSHSFYQPETETYVDPPHGGERVYYTIPETYYITRETIQDGAADYDALGRMTRYRDGVGQSVADVDKAWTYDANGNVRSIVTTYKPMNADGTLSTGTVTSSSWYKYDTMNRLTLSQGSFNGTAIVQGASGIALSYDTAGRRATSQTGSGAQEVYAYDAHDLVTSVAIGGVAGRVTSSYDALGRLIGHLEKDAAGNVVYERLDFVYNSRGQVLRERGRQKQGSDWLYTHTANYYNDTGSGGAAPAIASIATTGSSSGAVLYYSETKNWKNGNWSPVYGTPGNYSDADLNWADTYSTYGYQWVDKNGESQARQASHQLVNRDGTTNSSHQYDATGHLRTIVRTGGGSGANPDITFETDAMGLVVRRQETGTAPRSRTYRFGGREMGTVGNDGSANVDYNTTIARRDDTGSGQFTGGATTGTPYASFDANHTTMAGGAQGSPGGYTVQAGESLQSIAAALWGDASLWYKLAEANGLSAASSLAAGQRLTIPAGVVGNAHNAQTFKPYDPASALGDIAPSAATPKPKGNKCGTFGMILLAVVAVAVTVVTAGAALSAAGLVTGGVFGAGGGVSAILGGSLLAKAGVAGALAIGAASGAAGSIVSQGLGVATGIQEKFSWKGVGLAALGGAVGAFSGGSNFVERFVNGAINNATVQGVARLTGLQDKFSWAGVAAAGVGAGVGGEAAGFLERSGTGAALGGFGSSLALGAASAIANAATRSAIEGSSFGDNIRAAIPDVIGQAIGSAIAGGMGNRIARAGEPENLIPDAFYNDVPVQRPGAAMAASPVESGGVTLGETMGLVAAASSEGAAASGSTIVVTGSAGLSEPPGIVDGGWSKSWDQHWNRRLNIDTYQFDIDPYRSVYDWSGIDASFAADSDRLTELDYLTGSLNWTYAENAFAPPPSRYGSNLSISSYDPGFLRYREWGNAYSYRKDEAIALREEAYYNFRHADLSLGGLGKAGLGTLQLLGGYVSYATIPITGSLDLLHAATHGRGTWVAPADRQTSDVLVAVGSAAFAEFAAVGRLGSAGGIAAESSAANGLPKFTFRGDSRLEGEIFRDGFAPRGTSTDLMAHALNSKSPPSAYVPTSRSFDVATDFGDNVYVLRPTNGVDVNRTLGAASPFPWEQEIAILGRVSRSDIVAVTRPSEGLSILNPYYRRR